MVSRINKHPEPVTFVGDHVGMYKVGDIVVQEGHYYCVLKSQDHEGRINYHFERGDQQTLENAIKKSVELVGNVYTILNLKEHYGIED